MIDLSQNSLKIMQAKYLKKNEHGEVVETPEECLRRVAAAIAKPEETQAQRKLWEEIFFEVMDNLEFLPGGRTLANAGTNHPQLANCFVLPLEDNIEEIFEVVKESSILKKFGGGVGFSFSKIRPKGDQLLGTSGSACGPVVLMKILDSASEIFMQQGTRRSGNMVVLSVSHPDVLNFITVKKNQNSLAQINYSLGITDSFMKAVEKNKSWNLINPRTGKISAKVKARSIFEVATLMAWENGDPGMIFLDRINKDNPTPQLGPIEAVNLCGEQPLLPYEACNLGSINLTKFVKTQARSRGSIGQTESVSSSTIPGIKGVKFRELETIDWKHLEEVVSIAVRFLDNVIDAGRYPLSKVDRVVKSNRKIGLGIMGWADFLVKMGIGYNSIEGLKLAERIMKFFNDTAHKTSQKLGKEKGNFPNFIGSRWQKKVKNMRNATCTTIAPTGSISMVANVSSGIEPLFALSYYKEVMGGQRFFEKRFPELNALNSGNLSGKVLVTAHEISYDWHVKMQAAFQKYTDNAVSKTINLPHKATVEDVEAAFILSWKLGCKGITVYRDQSRSEQVLNIGTLKLEVGNGKLDNEMGNGKISKKSHIPLQNPASHISHLTSNDKCPTCQKTLVREEGCLHCPSCGFSACEI